MTSPIIEVLIGMVFLYSLLSILVTQINAVIANALRLRTKHLCGAIDELVQDKTISAKIIGHPLIRLTKYVKVLPEQRLSEEQAQEILASTLKRISWIDPHTFANVLMDIIRVNDDQGLFGALLDIIDGMPGGDDRRRLRAHVHKVVETGDGIPELRDLIDGMPHSAHKQALSKALKDIDDDIAGLGLESKNAVSLMAGLRQVNNPYLRSAMKSILATSQTLDEAEDKIAGWFNEGMGRASEAFANTMQYWSLGIGLVIAFTLNVDSLYIAKTLWNDPALRESVGEAVEQVSIDDLRNEVERAENQIRSPEAGSVDSLEQAVAVAAATLDDILNLRLPLTWSLEPPPAGDAVDGARYLRNLTPMGNPDDWLEMLVLKLAGLIGTTIAIAQGAPFWFGILQRLSGGASSSDEGNAAKG